VNESARPAPRPPRRAFRSVGDTEVWRPPRTTGADPGRWRPAQGRTTRADPNETCGLRRQRGALDLKRGSVYRYRRAPMRDARSGERFTSTRRAGVALAAGSLCEYATGCKAVWRV
jgi:hypothetical protein